MIKKHNQEEQEKQVQQAAEPEEIAAEIAEENIAESTEVALQKASQKIQALEQQLAESKEKQLRIFAEAENIKRRTSKDAEAARKFALENFVKNLLPVLDSFSSAKQAIPTEQKEVIAGVEMIESNFINILNDHKVEVLTPAIGEVFNPDIHQAMTTAPAEKGQKSNTVVEVFQQGFSLQGRLVRPALVIVAQ